MINWFSKNIAYPLWDIKDKSIRLKTLRELEQTQWLPEEDLKIRQWNKLKNILQYANDNCEYYREAFKANHVTPDALTSAKDFLHVPILTKKNIQENTAKLISKLYNKDSLYSAKTGGSTGKSLMLYFDKQCQEMRNASEMRSSKWAGWKIGSKRAAIWGNPPVAKTFKEKIRNIALNMPIFLDTMNLNYNSINDFIKLYRKHKPTVIFGHAHSIFIFAKFIYSKNIKDIKPSGIISTSMMLMPHERKFIEQIFCCKVTDFYGCEEVGLIACECEKHEGMHLNIDHLYIEFIKDDGTPAKPGEEGSIVVTDLINRGMPLIRYKVEDVGIPTDRKCSCGRGLPLMEKVTGRVADFLVKKDRSLVAGVSLIERTLTAIKGIEQMQIVQENINEFSLNVVKMNGYDSNSEQRLLNEFKNVFGDTVHIEINYVDRIPQESNGKFRFSICKIRGVNE